MANENDQQQQSQQQNAKNNEEMESSLECGFKNNVNKSCENLVSSKDSKNDEHSDYSATSKGKLNDLVADLCLNGHRPGGQNSQSQASYGDYTNIRATSGPVGVNEGSYSTASSVESSNPTGCMTAVSTHSVQQQIPTHNSSFSFKHFLSSSNVPTAPSTTVTSLDPPASNMSTTTLNTATSSRSLQTSTGARPKVPQSSSASSTSISALTVGGASDSQTSTTKMKRSPRFSSFDSQASLAEYVGSSPMADLPPMETSAGCSAGATNFRLYSDEKDRDRFQEWNLPSNAPTMTTNSTDYDRGSSYVPRSYSNYDVPRPQTSPRRRVGIGATAKDARPTRLALNTNQNPTTAAKLKLDLPLTSNSIGCGGSNGASCAGASSSSRKGGQCSRPSDFPTMNTLSGSAAAAAALPDFVQDHWMDSWYANDMPVNSPPSSPINSFMDDLTGAGASGVCSSMGQSGTVRAHNSTNRTLHLDNAPIPGPADGEDFNMGLPELSSTSVGSKMLPDFLSDGPIIHSSQRLADVAAGLPSNSIGSPEESSINNQLSRLRSENERLHRDLNDTRLALNEQTLRANTLERQLIEQQKRLKTEAEETLDKSEKRTTAVQTHVAKLKQQVQQLNAEVEMLKRENELMREEAAVGGSNMQNCDRSYAAAAVSSTIRGSTAAAVVTGTAIGGVGGKASTVAGSAAGATTLGIRSSIQHQLSRDLRRAASNAEHNLKQLLAGVENLRQMASNIEKSEKRLDYDASPDLFSDFLDECDEYDECPGGGPAL